MKILDTAIKWLFILVMPLFLLAASLAGAFNCARLYEYGFEKYEVSQTTGISGNELSKAASGLINYFNSPEELIDLTVNKDSKPFTLFNEREVIHLKDVKGLVWLDYGILSGTLGYLLAYAGITLFWRRDRRKLALSLLWGGGLTIGIMLAAGLAAFLNFDQFFLQFHLLSFANDFWQLDPARDYLIMLFPQGFWFDATLIIAVATVAGAAALGGTGYRLMSPLASDKTRRK